MIQEGREVRSRMDYILGTDLCLFGNVSVRDPCITQTTTCF